MSEVKSDRGSLDRSVTSDLWRNTLFRIPSVYGRLVYLSSLRNPNSGQYEHDGLALVFGTDQSRKALANVHKQVFAQWLSFSLKQQKEDLELSISGLGDGRRTALENWAELAPHRYLIPASATSVERRLYISDMQVLIDLLKSE